VWCGWGVQGQGLGSEGVKLARYLKAPRYGAISDIYTSTELTDDLDKGSNEQVSRWCCNSVRLV